ncbi:hypothetical protein IWW39_001850 [Coemansia spiralis]|uniref:Uncharacterized protein n=1 Tax=Coemansia spiralis TaxID=417178 RepID=A0A9W8GKA3_9FUNG|nr:hypothetical protein IWW39_001850 [Coemansia spiralis]
MSDRPLVLPHLDETHADTPKDIHGLAHPPLANSSSALGAYGGDPGLPRSAGYRLPPIGSFDYSPPRRSHLAGNFLPPPPRARSELPPPPMRSSRSGYVNTDYASRHTASPLGMLSDVAINSTNQPHGGNNAYGRHTQPPPPLAMSHSMHSLSTKPRFDPYASSTKHIPISSSRFDCAYRMPHIPDDRNYSASPWESPDPATRSNYSSNVASPALPRPNAFDSDAEMPVRAAREQAREMDSSCAMADVHVRRLSSLFDRTCINPGSPSPLLDRTNTCNGDQQRGLDGLDQTSNTGLATPEFDVRRVLCQEQPRAADIAWRTEEDPEKTPIVASVADGCKGMPVMAISSRHKKSLSGYKL